VHQHEGKTEFSQRPCNPEVERINVTNQQSGIGISSKRKTEQKQLTNLIETQRKTKLKQAETSRSTNQEKKLVKCMTKGAVQKYSVAAKTTSIFALIVKNLGITTFSVAPAFMYI